jgi:hypothetical protein
MFAAEMFGSDSQQLNNHEDEDPSEVRIVSEAVSRQCKMPDSYE